MKLENMGRDDWMLAGVALLLVIDLLFLPWFDINLGILSLTSTATGAPDGWLGVLAVLMALAVIADLGAERLVPATQLPALGASRTLTRLALSGACALFVVLKFLFHVHFSLFGFGFWAAIVLTAGLLVLAVRATGGQLPAFARNSSGGMPAGPTPPSA